MTENILEMEKEVQEKKKELSLLRAELRDCHHAKEKCFQNLKSAREKIKSASTTIKTIKGERDALTQEVRQLKEIREKLNVVAKESSSLVKDAVQRKTQLKKEEKISPGKIKAEILLLEKKIETNVMPFSKEQALTKRIKELRMQLKLVEEKTQAWKEANKLIADSAEKRKEAYQSHQQVQEKAQLSQEKHQRVTILFDEIKKLRSEEKALLEQCLQQKARHEQQKKKVEEAAQQLQQKEVQLRQQNQEFQQQFNVVAREKALEIEEKMKRGRKLSTKDILAFQAAK